MSRSGRDFERVLEICGDIEARATHFSSAIVRLATVLKDGQYVLHSAVVTFLGKGDKTKDEKVDYGELVLTKKRLDCKSICRLLKELVRNGTLTIEGLPSFEVKGTFTQDRTFIPSRSHYGYLGSNWPTKYVEYSIEGAGLPLPSQPLASAGLPLYPDGRKALIDFLKVINVPPRSILVQIPDYRVRITNLNIAKNKMKLEIEANVSPSLLRAMFYSESESGSIYLGDLVAHSPSLTFKGNAVEFEFEREPKYVLALVLNGKTGEKMDYRGYHFDWPTPEGVTIELVDIREIIRRGENLRVEFKSDLKDSNEFLETVVAFANTKGGVIFLGVSDDARIVGFEAKSRDQIANLIASNIEPSLDYNVQM